MIGEADRLRAAPGAGVGSQPLPVLGRPGHNWSPFVRGAAKTTIRRPGSPVMKSCLMDLPRIRLAARRCRSVASPDRQDEHSRHRREHRQSKHPTGSTAATTNPTRSNLSGPSPLPSYGHRPDTFRRRRPDQPAGSSSTRMPDDVDGRTQPRLGWALLPPSPGPASSHPPRRCRSRTSGLLVGGGVCDMGYVSAPPRSQQISPPDETPQLSRGALPSTATRLVTPHRSVEKTGLQVITAPAAPVPEPAELPSLG